MSSVVSAALVASPFSQAVKNVLLASFTSSAESGPVFTSVPVSLTADTKLNAPYPAPPTITTHTDVMIAALAPLRMPFSPSRLYRAPSTVGGACNPCGRCDPTLS